MKWKEGERVPVCFYFSGSMTPGHQLEGEKERGRLEKHTSQIYFTSHVLYTNLKIMHVYIDSHLSNKF